ncbi:bacteriocin immunity protein [Streptococcus oriscaviae]|uniref:Bacteriocin immunity protein n=1 Tax=Streptococcus oriscaviae TaxID=2781599 RepID=A0ABX7YQ51_9STRE|nr:bacteriocin immunity protein [Streptococcus oriscaviae]
MIDDIINLILVPTLTSEEREILVEYKDKLLLEPQKEANHMAGLAEELRQLAVRNLAQERTLSPEVGAFYQQIATVGQFDRNLASGLLSVGVHFNTAP